MSSEPTPQWFIDSDDIPKSTFSKPKQTRRPQSTQSKKGSSGIESELKKLVAKDKEKDAVIREQNKEIAKLRQHIIKIQKMSSSCKLK